MFYELRTYTLKPGQARAMAKAAATVGKDIRGNNFGTLEGYWITEIGTLNQVVHLWSYNDAGERARIRAELGKNPRWISEYVPMIRPLVMHQEVRLLNPVRPMIKPDTTGNIYELRNYLAKPGGAAKMWLTAFTGALEAREKYSKMLGLWQTDAPHPNELCHLWVYPDMNTRTEIRAKANKDPVWREYLMKAGEHLDAMHSTIMLPTPYSPMQ